MLETLALPAALRGIGGRRTDVPDAKRRIARDDLLCAQPRGKMVEHHGDRDARALDAGLAMAGSMLIRSRHSIVMCSMHVALVS